MLPCRIFISYIWFMKQKINHINYLILLFGLIMPGQAQSDFRGQFWLNLQNSDHQPFYLRYTPEFFTEWTLPAGLKMAVELSPVIRTTMIDQTWENTGKWHRYWLRMSGEYWEARIGLQKINFGPAKLLRTLQWFDALDVRDPVPFTSGVQSLLLRGYTAGNHNFWVWTVLADGKLKGKDLLVTPEGRLEYGGRAQFALPNITLAVSGHPRPVRFADLPLLTDQGTTAVEQKAAFDLSADWVVGLSLEAMYRVTDRNLLFYPEIQRLLTFGLDYTFPLGNGLSALYEQNWQNFTSWADEYPIPGILAGYQPAEALNISALQFSYSFDIMNQTGFMAYHSWTTGETVYFLSLQHTRDFIQIQMATNLYQGKKQLTSPFQAFYNEPELRLDLIFTH